ncbi:hypothetical protein LH67_05040 [Xenorhabdus nematophila]|nr:hypothetical protein LH67_05040 [Xenorhabdus nematophila]
MQIGLLTIHCLEDAMALFSDSMNHDLLSIIKKKAYQQKKISLIKKKIADKTKKRSFHLRN